MTYKLAIIDLLNIDKSILESYNSHFAVYTGISTEDTRKGTTFRTLYDSKEPDSKINGVFKIEQIIELGRETDTISKGYNAVVFISSNISIEDIIRRIEINEKGNFKNLCYLSTE